MLVKLQTNKQYSSSVIIFTASTGLQACVDRKHKMLKMISEIKAIESAQNYEIYE
jgi:hypothetical protein